MNSHWTISVLSWAALALLTGGGQRGDPSRLPLHGPVKTSMGEPLNASIEFRPSDANKRPVAIESVTDGEYHFDRTRGPTAGPTDIVVRRRQEDRLRPLAKSKPGPQKRSEWKQRRLIADDGQYLQDFTLED
jgi:hypothetical protein